MRELTPTHDSRKSFYGKAKVKEEPSGSKTLFSYDTAVATVKNRTVTLFPAWSHSATTLRHVKEFLRQNDLPADTKTQIEADYAVKAP